MNDQETIAHLRRLLERAHPYVERKAVAPNENSRNGVAAERALDASLLDVEIRAAIAPGKR